MGVRLSTEEAWVRVAAAHTGILTTMRRDGRPVPLPVWFAVSDQHIYVRSLKTSYKVKRIERDPRSAFLVESGDQWSELAAVLVQTTARIVADDDEAVAATEMIAAKYAGRGHGETVPEATQAHYAAPWAVIRLEPLGALISWDNSRLR